MLLTYEIKDEHVTEFLRIIGETSKGKEADEARLNLWLAAQVDPTYSIVVKNHVDGDPEVIAAKATLDGLLAQKLNAAKQ